MSPLGTPDRVVDAELDASGITIGDVGLQVNGSDVSAANPVPVTMASGGNAVTLPAKVAVKLEKTRPADATPYAAKDVICESDSAGTVWTFASVARANGGSGTIVGVRLMTDQKTNVAAYRVHFFRTAPTAINDNSPYLLLYANAANRIGSIDIPNLATEDATNSTGAEGLNTFDRLPFVCDAGADDLFAMVETLTIFTPATGQKYTVEVVVERD